MFAIDHCLSRDLLAKEMEQNLTHAVENNTFNTGNPTYGGTQAPVSAPYSGQIYNNPTTYPVPAPQPVPAYVPPQATAVPAQATGYPVTAVQQPTVPSSTPGPSLYDQLKEAQLAAEKNGSLEAFAGTNVPEPKNTSSEQDDMAAAQTGI